MSDIVYPNENHNTIKNKLLLLRRVVNALETYPHEANISTSYTGSFIDQNKITLLVDSTKSQSGQFII
jgi:hypothetical protein